MMAPYTITVFNALPDGGWLRTFIHNASWRGSQAVTFGNSTLSISDSYTIRIPANANTDGHKYVNGNEWIKLSDNEKRHCWTLREGDKIVKGIVSDKVINLKSFNQFAEVITVTSFSDNRLSRSELSHWKVCGK